MKELTKKQQEVYGFVVKFITMNGYAPSNREIASNFDITAKGAYDHLHLIEKKGYIKIVPKISRGIILI